MTRSVSINIIVFCWTEDAHIACSTISNVWTQMVNYGVSDVVNWPYILQIAIGNSIKMYTAMQEYFSSESYSLMNDLLVFYNKTGPNNKSYEEEYKVILREFQATLIFPFDSRLVLLISLNVTVFLSAFVGNSLALLVILLNKPMRTVTNLMLVNLALTDLAGEWCLFKKSFYFIHS